jgi:hypothetical protein
MSRRSIWTLVFLTLTGGALGMELWAGLDSSPDTVPWTDLLARYVPQPITFTAIAILTAWLPLHFTKAYQRSGGGPMKGFKFKPVAWMTTILAVLTALEALNETTHVVPEKYNAWILSAIGLLTVALGVLAHNRVTPTAAPKDDAGTPLVPKTLQSRL